MITTLRIHEHIYPGRRLGRHVRHDPRSRSFAAPAGELATVFHARRVPAFDQGEIGCCTGAAMAGALSSGPFCNRMTEADAVDLYSLATRLDALDGSYPPTDTGSSGLAVAKAAVSRGLVAGYRHGFGVDHALAALALGPGIVGITWHTGCDEPAADGRIAWAGYVRGGHELVLAGYDAEFDRVWLVNSWGPGWGVGHPQIAEGGCCYLRRPDFARALDDRGDVVFPTPP